MSRQAQRRATIKRRSSMSCVVRDIKISWNSLSKSQREILIRLFLEAKWFTNCVIANNGDVDTTIKEVEVLTPDGVVIRELKHLPAQVKQDLVMRFRSNLKTLSALKERGVKVGKIDFIKNLDSIPFRNDAYKIKGTSRMRLPKVGWFRVIGLHQLAFMETANCVLVRKADGLHIHMTCYADDQSKDLKMTKSGVIKQRIRPEEDSVIGVDFGISAVVTTSDGHEISTSVGESDRLKSLQDGLSKTEKGSNNRRKLRHQIRKEYLRLTNIKNDAANKIVAVINSRAKKVIIQNDNIKGWHSGWFGKQVQHGVHGRVKRGLINKGAVVVGRFLPTTKKCYICDHVEKLSLTDRVFTCGNCGYSEHRDVKAAKSIAKEGGFVLFESDPIFDVTELQLNQPTHVEYNVSGSDAGLLDCPGELNLVSSTQPIRAISPEAH